MKQISSYFVLLDYDFRIQLIAFATIFASTFNLQAIL